MPIPGSPTPEYITQARQAAQKLWDAYHALKSLQDEWQGKDYGSTLPDGTGQNAGITKTMVGAVVFDTAEAITTLLNAGHKTNLANLL